MNLMRDDSWPDEVKNQFSAANYDYIAGTSEDGNDKTIDGNIYKTGNEVWLTSDASKFYELSNQLFEGNVQTAKHGLLPQNLVGVSDYIEDTDTSTPEKEAFNPSYPIIQPTLDQDELSIPSASTDPTGHRIAKARNEVEKQKFSYKSGLVIEVAGDGSIEYLAQERNSTGDLKYNLDGSPKNRKLVPKDNFAVYHEFIESDGTITSGMHDKRQAADLNIVEIDIEALKDLVHDNDKSDWGGNDEQTPEKWWNGIVYVEFETENTTSTRPDFVNPAKKGYGVKLKNGRTIPSPDFAVNKGMTMATNQMLYVQGHYNADGDLSTGSPTEPDEPEQFGKEGAEAPAALVADSITFLSEEWEGENSNLGVESREAADTEISAAILTGIVPSAKTAKATDEYSGGVENFPRLIESWKGKDLVIRGSMVALFESEVGTAGWSYTGIYEAPGREWGFNTKFAEGFFPPGTPNTRRYRSVDFELVDQATYEARVDKIKKLF